MNVEELDLVKIKQDLENMIEKDLYIFDITLNKANMKEYSSIVLKCHNFLDVHLKYLQKVAKFDFISTEADILVVYFKSLGL